MEKREASSVKSGMSTRRLHFGKSTTIAPPRARAPRGINADTAALLLLALLPPTACIVGGIRGQLRAARFEEIK